jgi:hypothetical protein
MEWISVKNKPMPDKMCLVWFSGDHEFGMKINGNVEVYLGGRWVRVKKKVNYWAELPAAPELRPMSYDNNYLHNHLEDDMATYSAKHEALAAQIRLNLSQSDYQLEIECGASLDAECNQAISSAFYGEDAEAVVAVLHGFAQKWLDNHAAELATQRLHGQQD